MPACHGQPLPALLDLLKEWEDLTRQTAKIEIPKHSREDVQAAVGKWVAGLDKSDKEYEHHRLEGLWTLQWNGIVDGVLLQAVLKSPEPRARAAATRVLCYQKDSLPNALDLLKVAVNDSDMAVRMHAVRALSFYQPTDGSRLFEIAYAPVHKLKIAA